MFDDLLVPGPAIAAVVAFTLAIIATPLVRAFARHVGAVAVPKADRWHTKPTAMMGGVAIYLAVTITMLLVLPSSREKWIVLAASTALFVIGLIDDAFHIKPYQKLIGQLLGSAAVVYFGLVLPWTGSFALNMMITFFWLVGVTNAINMLDNMDGLAAGIAAIAAIFLAINFQLNGQINETLMLAGFCGALLAFLVFNHNPASIFMGDCGSMFVGFFLASTALLSGNAGGGRSRSVIAVLAVPVLVLCIPIFDTTFVTLMRKLAGRAASQGGRDHTSHRLVALGLSEKHAVWMLYSFASLAGLLALLVRRLDIDVSLAAIASFTILLSLVGVYLGRVRVYADDEVEAARQKPIVAFLLDLSHKRRVFEVLLDVTLMVLAYYAAYALIFGPARLGSGDWQLFLKTLPVVVFIKLATFLGAGVYRGMWKYVSIADMVVFGKAVVLSSVFCIIAIVFAFRFDGFSRTVFVVDGLLLLLLSSTSRFAFRVMQGVMPLAHGRSARRVIIYGAGDGGELLWRELRNNSELGCVPVAFIDDDPRKAGKLLHGLRIYSGSDSLPDVCRKTAAEEVFLSTFKLPVSRLLEVVAQCEALHIPVKRTKMEIQRIADTEIGWVLDKSGRGEAAQLTSAELLALDAPRLSVSSMSRLGGDH